jgi:hypothetical protein
MGCEGRFHRVVRTFHISVGHRKGTLDPAKLLRDERGTTKVGSTHYKSVKCSGSKQLEHFKKLGVVFPVHG